MVINKKNLNNSILLIKHSALLITYLLFIVSCTNYNNNNDDFYINNSGIGSYLNPDSSIHLMSKNCLENLMNSLDGIFWKKNKTKLLYGFLCTPKYIQFKDTIKEFWINNLDKFLVIKNVEIEKTDTIYWVLGLYFSYENQAFFPCKFKKKNSTILIFNDLLINPKSNYLKNNNCMLNFYLNIKHPGLYKLLKPDSSKIKKLNSYN